ncbi:hypothetical protein L345_12230, partial [Ophiophagus hannah]
MGRFLFVTLSLLVVAFSLNDPAVSPPPLLPPPPPPFLLATFSLSFFSSHTGANSCCCPQDWLPKNGFCYKVFNDRKNWNDAETFCRKHKPGCHLASIHGSEESTELAEYVSDYLRSDRSRSSYLTWQQGEPNNLGNNENCVELWSPSGKPRWREGSRGCASKSEGLPWNTNSLATNSNVLNPEKRD